MGSLGESQMDALTHSQFELLNVGKKVSQRMSRQGKYNKKYSPSGLDSHIVSDGPTPTRMNKQDGRAFNYQHNANQK
jgi:hypothetical protein